MRLMIDIPDKIYETVQNGTYCGTLYEELKNGTPLSESEDCVSRQAVIEVLNKMDRYVADELTLCDTERKFPQNEVFIVDDVYEEIVEQLPPVNPAEKVGQWEWNQYDGNPKIGNFHCSQCHGIGKSYYDYCPYCGAKMEGKE